MKISNTSDRLKEIMQQRNLKQVDILQATQPYCQKYDVKLGKNDLSQYVSGKVEPGQRKLTVLSHALNVSEVWLMGYDVPMNKEKNIETEQLDEFNLTLNEKRHIKKYRTLDEYGKEAVDGLLDTEYKRCTAVPEEEKPEIVQIRIAQLPASAGTGVELYEENYKIMSVRASDFTRQADFAVKVSGDSMEDTFFDGDILLIESMPFINEGDIGIFVVNGDGYVKEYGGDRLISHNDKYPDIKLTEHDVVICSGRVICALEESDFID